METQLVNLSVGDVVKLRGKKCKIIYKYLSESVDEEKIPKEGISFNKSPELMHLVLENVETLTQQKFSGDTMV
ncbi:unnamed protein product, partial [marine sediment metagenome]